MVDDIDIANYIDDSTPFVPGDTPLNLNVKTLGKAAEKLVRPLVA